mgnify:CR=1 FL=1
MASNRLLVLRSEEMRARLEKNIGGWGWWGRKNGGAKTGTPFQIVLFRGAASSHGARQGIGLSGSGGLFGLSGWSDERDKTDKTDKIDKIDKIDKTDPPHQTDGFQYFAAGANQCQNLGSVRRTTDSPSCLFEGGETGSGNLIHLPN